MTVNDNTRKAEGLSQLFKTIGKVSAMRGWKLAGKELENLGAGLEIGSKIGSAAVSRNPIASSYIIPDVIHFIMLVKIYILEKLAE